jgi:energy-coupling factor transport system permease protein
VRHRLSTYFMPRDLHPGAWWVWALSLAAAASRTTNPWLLLTICAVVCYVVVARRSEAPWAMSFRMYVYLAVFVVVMRVVWRIIFGGAEGSTVILPLPEIPLPEWASGIRLFGAVSAESVLGGLYDGLRLATIIICVGAANALANPKRLLKTLPPALYELGTAVIVALSVFPQLAESVQRVHAARKLRGNGTARLRSRKSSTRTARARGLHAVAIPVLEDSLDRSLQLASSMDSRGYGRAGDLTRRTRWTTGLLMITGLAGVCVGVYATLDGTTPRVLAGPVLAGGLAVAFVGFTVAGRRVQRTLYRPDRWHLAEFVVAASGITAATVMFATSAVDPGNLHPSLSTLGWPELAWTPFAGVLIALVPAFATPAPEPLYAAMDDDPTVQADRRELARTAVGADAS